MSCLGVNSMYDLMVGSRTRYFSWNHGINVVLLRDFIGIEGNVALGRRLIFQGLIMNCRTTRTDISIPLIISVIAVASSQMPSVSVRLGLSASRTDEKVEYPFSARPDSRSSAFPITMSESDKFPLSDRLARAILAAPDILILDEPTSSLDVESENKIKEAMKVLDDQMTVVIVAHRASTIEGADVVYRIVDEHATAVEYPTEDGR